MLKAVVGLPERLATFLTADSIPTDKKAQVFFINYTKATSYLLSKLKMEDIQYSSWESSLTHAIRERYKFCLPVEYGMMQHSVISN